jgi:hypothetical protein
MKVPAWRHKFRRALFARPAAGGAWGVPPMLTINTNIFVTAVFAFIKASAAAFSNLYDQHFILNMHIIFIFLVAGHAVAHGGGAVEALVSGWIDFRLSIACWAVVARPRKRSPARHDRYCFQQQQQRQVDSWRHSKFVDIISPHHYSST